MSGAAAARQAVLVDAEWLSTWRVSVTAAVGELLGTFRQRFGFEPATNELGPPASEEAMTSLAALPATPAQDLLAFYRTVGEVSLPDVGNDYFIHPPGLAVQHAQAGELHRIGPPVDAEVLVFASDGGGALYALPAAQAGPVYRLRDCPSGMVWQAHGASRSSRMTSKRSCNP